MVERETGTVVEIDEQAGESRRTRGVYTTVLRYEALKTQRFR
jgi:hypothetical protein